MKKLLNKKTYLIAGGVLLITVGAVIFALFGTKHNVTVIDGTSVAVVTTRGKTTGEILKLSGYELFDGDRASTVKDGTTVSEIVINRANTLTLIHDGTSDEIKVLGGTVGEAIDSFGITLGNYDTLDANPNDDISEDMTVTLQRVQYTTVTDVEEIPFEVSTSQVRTVPKGTTRVVTQGENGQKQCTYDEIYVDGECVHRSEVAETVLKNPVTQVQKTGIGGTINGHSYSYYIDMKAYAYTSNGRTSTGKAAAVGMAAVDRSVIPLGTKLYVASPKGTYTYGTCSAEDTGGNIKGNVIDLFMSSLAACRQFGVRTMRVYILD